MTLTFDLLTPKSIGHTLDPCRVFVWSFKMIPIKGKQLCNINHFQLSMHCDLDLWPFDPEILGHILYSWGVFVWSFMMVSVKGKQSCARIILPNLTILVINALWPRPLTFSPKKNTRAHPLLIRSMYVKFHDDRCKGKTVMRLNHFT